jgi:hypothetical protein
MRGGKRQGEKAELVATEDKQSRINGLWPVCATIDYDLIGHK